MKERRIEEAQVFPGQKPGERVMEVLSVFSDQEFRERLWVKNLRLVLPDRARQLGVDIPGDALEPVFVSERGEDMTLSELHQNMRWVVDLFLPFVSISSPY